jgi:hypothetical protein
MFDTFNDDSGVVVFDNDLIGSDRNNCTHILVS